MHPYLLTYLTIFSVYYLPALPLFYPIAATITIYSIYYLTSLPLLMTY